MLVVAAFIGVEPENVVAGADLAPAFATVISIAAITPKVTDFLVLPIAGYIVPFCFCTLCQKIFLLHFAELILS